MKKILLFAVPFLITTVVLVGYFKLTNKFSEINIPDIPTISFSDLVKLSRFSLEKAPSQSLVGTITSMSGDVDYEKRLATESARLTSPVEIQQGETLETLEGAMLTLDFEDKVKVTMSEKSYLNVIQTLPANIVFYQNKGSINYKKISNVPVSVRLYHLLVNLDGDIDLFVDLENRNGTVITLEVNSGTAEVAYNDIDLTSHVLSVGSGRTLIFNESNRKAVVE